MNDMMKLVVDQQLPEIEQTVLRIHSDAKLLRANMTPSQVRQASVIIEHARDILSGVLDRARLP
jgi:hypothetical protein